MVRWCVNLSTLVKATKDPQVMRYVNSSFLKVVEKAMVKGINAKIEVIVYVDVIPSEEEQREAAKFLIDTLALPVRFGISIKASMIAPKEIPYSFVKHLRGG